MSLDDHWLDQRAYGDSLRTELVVYAIARLSGADGITAARQTKTFVTYVTDNWSYFSDPTRREIFTALEAVIFQPNESKEITEALADAERRDG